MKLLSVIVLGVMTMALGIAHGKDGAPPDAIHSKTSYSKAMPSGSS
jgi:hypothetical protein